jgi:hypothetical protein
MKVQWQVISYQIDHIAARLALEIYGSGVKVDVLLEGGSLLVRISLIGTLLWGGYDAISK